MSGATKTESPSKWGVALLLGVVAIAVRALTHPSVTSTPEPMATSPAPMVTTHAPALPTTPPEVSRTDIDRAARHAGLAFGADGVAGARFYSVNCYASLQRTFAVAALDRCGAFDILAARRGIDPLEQVEVATWFDAAAARRRFMDAALAGGLSADDAAARLSRVGELSNSEPVEPVAPAPAVAEEPSEPEGTEATAGEQPADLQDNPGEGDDEPNGE